MAVGAAACSSAGPGDRPQRFAVLPYQDVRDVEGALRVGVAWIVPGGDERVAVADAVDVPAIGQDFEWEPSSPPPPESLRCIDIGCGRDETAAVGWIVAFVDRDGDGAAEVRIPAGSPWSPAFLVAPGVDLLVGLATGHAVAYAERTLPVDSGLSRTLGWPLTAGLSLMRVRHRDRGDLLEPVANGERVPVFLLQRGEGNILYPNEELGLCCDPEPCDHETILCPTFQGQGDRLD